MNWHEIGPAARQAALAAASARAANGNPMTDDEIENRARNAQDREDLRTLLHGGSFSANCKTMSRSELVAEANDQLASGLYGGSKGAFKMIREFRDDKANTPRRMPANRPGTCDVRNCQINVGDTIYWNPQTHSVTCEKCF